VTRAYEIRKLIRAALPTQPDQYDTPDKNLVYLPRKHADVLDVERMLVVGERGTGKSFWAKSLIDPAIQALAREVAENRRLPDRISVQRGWDAHIGVGEDRPTHRDIEGLLRDKISPRAIWAAIYLFAVGVDELKSLKTWQERASFLHRDASAWGRLFRSAHDGQANKSQHALVIFDEIDRVSDDPRKRLELLRGLLQLLLELRGTRFLRAKVFVRPDMIEAPEAKAFPDASKLVDGQAALRWDAIDLYALLWHRLANHADAGEAFRKFATTVTKDAFARTSGVFRISEGLRSDPERQRTLLHALTGPAMGPNKKRGIPYVWLPNHLADARGTLTVRSFLIALAEASQDDGHLDHPYPLHWDAIKNGVRKASERRRSELEEDLPWADKAMTALKGLEIPCRFQDMCARWSEGGTLAAVHASERPPALRADDEPASLRDALKAAGVLDQRTDGRWNVPDVYRVAYGLPLRGGVAPKRV
jgi:hypothetical protein